MLDETRHIDSVIAARKLNLAKHFNSCSLFFVQNDTNGKKCCKENDNICVEFGRHKQMTAGKAVSFAIRHSDDVLSIYNPNPIGLPYYTPKELEITNQEEAS